MERASSPKLTLDALRSQLQIDPDDLDSGLIQQPELYEKVATAYVTAVAKRDEAKLDLEQAAAVLDEQYRKKAADAEEKITEAALTRKLSATPKLMELERELLHLRAEADRWQALKEAFQQRSFMLRELVAIFVRRMGELTLDRGAQDSHRNFVAAKAEVNHAAAAQLRRDRRADK